ncbi:MAG: cupin domain-containing protein [Anaerolineales bacterium]
MDQPIQLEELFGDMAPNGTARVIASIGDVVLKAVQIQNKINNWHSHDFDESFLVLDGVFAVEFEGGREVILRQGDFYTV